MATNTEDHFIEEQNRAEDHVEETRLIPFQMSNTVVAAAAESPTNSLEMIDPSIMADRETSMIVTGWVRANYVQEREHNVPRRNMFEHYKAFCTATDLTPVNSATFGKLLRVVFPELKTRRLGVRGQSKYHYCGIRVRTSDDVVIPPPTTPSMHATNTATIMNQPFNNMYQYNQPPPPTNTTARGYIRSNTSPISSASGSIAHAELASPSPGPSSFNHPLPTFTIPNITSTNYRYESDNNLIASFTAIYERHCREIFSLISTNQVEKVRDAMASFYHEMPDQYIRIIHELPEITEAVWRWDCSLYDAIIFTFLPTVNHPLSQDITRCLRVYTRELRDYIQDNLNHFPTTFFQKKADVARIFSAKFRRQLSLNSAAQTGSTILNMSDHVAAMRHDWERLDFDGILDQTLWVCECDTNEIRTILRQDIYGLLSITRPCIERWMEWITSLVDKYLKRYTPTSINEANHYLNRSKQLLLKWTFYASLIIKDLTVQQARSFGSFHSLGLFLDDYILYLVEENIAQVNYTLMQQQHDQQASSSGAPAGTPVGASAGGIYYSSPTSAAATGKNNNDH